MTRSGMLAAVLAAAALFACAKDKDPGAAPDPAAAEKASEAKLRPLTIDQVEQRLAAHDGKTFVYDANPKEVWQARHVPGAKWVEASAVTAADLPADKTATLIFYCHNET